MWLMPERLRFEGFEGVVEFCVISGSYQNQNGARMHLKDLVSLYFERSSAMQTLWSMYITIVLGLLALFGTIKPSPRKAMLALILSIGFVCFACVNGLALYDCTVARVASKTLIVNFKATSPAEQVALDTIKPAIRPPTTTQLVGFHIGCDVLVVIAIGFLTFYKRQTDEVPA